MSEAAGGTMGVAVAWRGGGPVDHDDPVRTGGEAGEVTEQHDERAPDDPALERVGPWDGRVIARATATVRMIQLPGT